MKINIRQRLLLFSSIILAGIVLVGYASYISNQKLKDSEQWVQHTEQVIYQSGNISSLAKDIETASRGFVITGDSAYLGPLYSAEKTIFVYIRQLRQLTRDNPAQQQRIDSLSVYVHKRVDFSYHSDELRSIQGLTSAVDYISSKQGKQYNDHIRQITNAIQQEENTLLEQRKQINEHNLTVFNRISVGSFILRVIFTILFIVICGNYLLQNIEKGKRAAELIIAKKELAFQTEEKGKRATELIVADKELAFQSEEKGKRAAELIIANKELLFQNEEKEKRAVELIIANKDLKKYFDSIVAKEALLSKVEGLAHLGSWQQDLITKQVIWADETFRIYGYYSGQVTPSHEAFLEAIHPDDQLRVKNAIEEALAGNADTLKITYRLINKNNALKYANSEMFFERDDERQPILITGFVQDVTLSKLAEEKLYKSQGRLLESQIISHVGSWEIIDLAINHPITGSPLYWSDEVFRIFGMEPGEADMTTSSFLQMVHPGDRDAVNREFREAFNNRRVYNIDHRIICKDSTERIVRQRGEIIYDSKTRKRLKMIGTVQDITERKIVELERLKITADLIQRNNDLEQFTYIVSHNLRAPVANIIGFSESLVNEKLNKSDMKEVINGISESVHRLDAVIHDLNNILKVKSESGELKEVIKLSSIVDSIKINSSHHIEKANATIITDFSAIDELFSLKSYIYSIFYNLIVNSVKYRRADVEPVIEIKSAKVNNKIILSFKDNGMGIDLTKRGDQVFGLYKRFHTHVEGKGVGLFMVKTQVETLGGKISINSEVDKGTEFIIELSL